MDNDSRPKNIPGYEEPVNITYSKNTRYKIFSEGKQIEKNEEFKSHEINKNYISYGTLLPEENKDIICPVCNEKARQICNCHWADKKCNNNHCWYIDRDGEIKVGKPHS